MPLASLTSNDARTISDTVSPRRREPLVRARSTTTVSVAATSASGG
ncbi:MAG TPA: hypothetical protein VMF13_05385 [Luteitalea sp.]|nr:hypothetical protein [Luteitalea sp.]